MTRGLGRRAGGLGGLARDIGGQGIDCPALGRFAAALGLPPVVVGRGRGGRVLVRRGAALGRLRRSGWWGRPRLSRTRSGSLCWWNRLTGGGIGPLRLRLRRRASLGLSATGLGRSAPADAFAVDPVDQILHRDRGGFGVRGVGVTGSARRVGAVPFGGTRRGIPLPRGATSGPWRMPVPIVTHQRTSLFVLPQCPARLLCSSLTAVRPGVALLPPPPADRSDSAMITIPPRSATRREPDSAETSYAEANAERLPERYRRADHPPLCIRSAPAGTAGSSGSSSQPCGSATLPGEPWRPRGPSASRGNGTAGSS